MTKKELLIILVLAVLVTVGSFVRETLFMEWLAVGGGGHLYARGAPFPYYITNPVAGSRESPFMVPFAILDFLFWFLVLAAGWWGLKRIKKIT